MGTWNNELTIADLVSVIHYHSILLVNGSITFARLNFPSNLGVIKRTNDSWLHATADISG